MAHPHGLQRIDAVAAAAQRHCLSPVLVRVFAVNMMTLMLSVLDEVVDGMSISLAGVSDRHLPGTASTA